MREARKYREFAEDAAEVSTTKFTREAATAMPARENMPTKGLNGLIQLVPGGDGEDGQQRQGVEEANAEGYRINRLGQGAFGVFGFRHSGTDQLSTHEGEERNLEGAQEARQALG